MELALQQGAALRDQERLELFSQTTEESLWDWNVDRNEHWWGGNVERLFGGIPRGAMRADWRRERVHPDDADRVTAAFEAALRGPASAWNLEYRLRGLGDEPIHVREHVYFLREANGRAHRVIGTVRDISTLKGLLLREQAARSDAERASGVKDEFLAMLGHELRNPLAPIVSVLSILERKASGPDRSLEILRRQTQHLVRLVDDLLDVSRISSGKVELAMQRVAIAPLVHRALEMVHPLIEQRNHRVELDIDETLVVQADAARMTQVLTNLFANAAKYTEPGGTLAISAQAHGEQVTLEIRDNGIGIPPEVLPNIFDLFTQGRQAMDRAQGGLGLGLSIVKNIVSLHGGTVQAQSAGVGHGTTVTLRLPLSRFSIDELPSAPTPGETLPDARELLVIDDNEDAATLHAQLLAAQGHSVRVAHHPMEALRLFSEKTPDVALVDIGLPSMDGYELADRMRQLPGGAHAKLVALTGYGLASDKVRALAAGFDAHVVKPVGPERLQLLISQLTGGAAAS